MSKSPSPQCLLFSRPFLLCCLRAQAAFLLSPFPQQSRPGCPASGKYAMRRKPKTNTQVALSASIAPNFTKSKALFLPLLRLFPYSSFCLPLTRRLCVCARCVVRGGGGRLAEDVKESFVLAGPGRSRLHFVQLLSSKRANPMLVSLILPLPP